MLTVFILGIIQSLYDFAVWYGIFKENDAHPKKLYFRIPKEILDFVVVPSIAYFYFDVSIGVLIAFFIAKWFHLCDTFYNIYRVFLTGVPTSQWGYWRWWTPLGLLRTNFYGVCILKGFTREDYQTGKGHWHPYEEITDFSYYKYGFSVGMVSAEESYIQCVFGLLIACLILCV